MNSFNDIYDMEWKRGMKFIVKSEELEGKRIIEWKDKINVIL